MKFSVIIGNPPYQDGSRSNNVIPGGGKRNLYQQFTDVFIDKFEIAFAFITPRAIFKATEFDKTTPILSHILQYNLELVKMLEDKTFNVGVRTCYFILTKTPYLNTHIISDDEVFADIRKYKFIPSRVSKHTYNILFKMMGGNNGMKWERDKLNPLPPLVSMHQLQGDGKRDGSFLIDVGNKYANKSGSLTWTTNQPEKVAAFMNSPIMRWWRIVNNHNGIIYRKFLNGVQLEEPYLTPEEIDYIEETING